MQNIYWHDVSMYKARSGTVTLDQLITECSRRLHVLLTIQNQKKILSEKNDISRDNLRRSVVDELELVDCGFYVKSLTAPSSDSDEEYFENRKLDLGAHVMLTTILSTAQSGHWLFVHECDLFNLRLFAIGDIEFDKWLKENDYRYERVNTLEKIKCQEKLVTYLKPEATLEEVYNTKFYKIPLELSSGVTLKNLCVNKGIVYLTQLEVRCNIIDHFARLLKQKIDKVMQIKSMNLEILDERIFMVEKILKTNFRFVFEKNIDKYPVSENDIVKLVNECFPPCMTRLDDVLKRIHQLKHSGRRQYQLFLKDIGLSVEECVSYMRKNYKGLDDYVFKRQYGYYIRHDYGLEGSRITYKSFSCANIIDHTDNLKLSGCPFTDNDKRYYGARYNMCANHITDIEDLVKYPNNETKACSLLFKNRYGKDVGGVVESPVQYFTKSNFFTKLGK